MAHRTLPQLASAPKMAALVRVEEMTDLAMVSALPSLLAPVTVQVMRCLAPSPSEAMDRAMERLAAERQESRLTVTFQNRVSAVALRDISYIEFSVRSATIHAGTRVLRTYEKLSSLQQRVDSRFIQCHKSYLVNMDYVIGFQGNALELCGGVEIPVSQSRAKVTREALLDHLTRGIS